MNKILSMLGDLGRRISAGSDASKPAGKWAALGLAAVMGFDSSPPARADVCVFDNVSNFENGNTNAQLAQAATPNYFMGDGYMLAPGTTNITGFDIFPLNASGSNYTGIKITIYVWQNVNLGVVNSAHFAFSNLLATFTGTSSGAFNNGFYVPFEGSPAGSSPGIALTPPLAISGTNIGITFNYQGTYDGTTYFNTNNLTSIISYGTPPTVGGQIFNGYYRNVAGDVDGNFTNALKTFTGQNNQSALLRVFGNVAASVQRPTLQVSRTGTNVNLSWSTVPTRSYQVQYQTNLTQAAWLSLGGVVIATNATMTATDTITGSPQRFYRIAMLPATMAAPPVGPNLGELKGPFVLETNVLNPNPGTVAHPTSSKLRATLNTIVQPRAVPLPAMQGQADSAN